MHEVGVVHNAIESLFSHVFVKVVECIIMLWNAQSCMKSNNFYATDFTTDKEIQKERSRAIERLMREREIPQK